MLKFNAKAWAIDEATKMNYEELSAEELLNQALNLLKQTRHDVVDVVRTIKKYDEQLATEIDNCKHQIMPEGKMDDWRWNKMFKQRNSDRLLTTENLEPCVEKISGLQKKDEYRYNDDGQTLYFAVLRLKGAIATADRAIGIMAVNYPVYLETVKPEPITHYSYDPSKPLTEQALPGFIWKRLSARGITPTNLSEQSVYEALPNLWYKMEKNDYGTYKFYNLKSTGKFFERRHYNYC